MTPGWFSMAVHALALLSQNNDGYCSSYLAGSVNTHAVFLRRVLKRLVDANLIETREGQGGGYRLARPADTITLADVYRALQLEPAIAPSPADPNPLCPTGSGIRASLAPVTDSVEEAIATTLQNYTIAEIAERAVANGLQGTPASR